ncbi:MAG: peptidase domain-containing ABC transporter, partial [Phycisphaerae bacterium]|nr:peptidase domain-containing ABC transporter [Gemmatimonadaceae bacterium]
MGRAKYHWVKQQSGEDCAAASLAIVCSHHGRPMRIDRIRQAVETGSGGATFASLRRGAEALGFLTKVLHAPREWLDSIDAQPMPAILYWKGYHLVVLYGCERAATQNGAGDVYVVSDPGMGVRRLSRAELEEGWHGGIVLILKPHPVRFYLQEPDTQRLGSAIWRHLNAERSALVAVSVLGVATGA